MYILEISSRLKKDLDLAKKRGWDMEPFKEVVKDLSEGKTLPAANKKHHLEGRWKLYDECHIAPDWVLIFRYKKEVLMLARTGTHSDVF